MTELDYKPESLKHWPEWLSHLAGKPDVIGLEVGTFQGESAEWMLRNIFTHTSSFYFCVDNFKGSVEHHCKGLDCSTLESESRSRLKPFSNFRILKGSSNEVLRALSVKLDFIYVDAAHDTMNVLRDAVLAFELLKPKGIMLFDDYHWENMPDELDRPKIGIDSFLKCYAKHIEVIEPRGWQICLRKK